METTRTNGWSYGSQAVSNTETISLTDGSVQIVDAVVVKSTTDTQVSWTCDIDKVEHLYILSDAAVTIETNSSSAADDTLAIAAGIAFEWRKGSGITCPTPT